MANKRVQIKFNDNTYFDGVLPDGLIFDTIDTLPDTFQTSYCGQLWRKKDDVTGIKVEDLTVAERDLGFSLSSDPTWELLVIEMYGELGRDLLTDYYAANVDDTFLSGVSIYP